jgi:hypothetical protein
VLPEHQCPCLGCQVENALLADGCFFREDVEDRQPIRVLEVEGKVRPVLVRLECSPLANWLGTYPSSAMAASTRARVSRLQYPELLIYRETVIGATLARFLTTLDAAFSPIEAHWPGCVIQVYLS